MEDWKSIVTRGVESDELDYKGPMNWNELPRSGKAKLVRHALALANTKGGFIVIGVEEDASGRPSVYRGLSEAECASFDPTPVIGFVNACADPPIDLAVERPMVEGKRYAVLAVKPFSGLPHVCSRGVAGELQEGVFYIRTPEASSRAAHRASELHGLILRALRNQRNMLAKMLRGILYENDVSAEAVSRSADYFYDEFSDLRNYFLHRHSEKRGEFRIEICIAPGKYRANRFSLKKTDAAAKEAFRLEREGVFPGAGDLPKFFRAGNALRLLADERTRLWQLNKSGLLGFIRAVPLAGGEKFFDMARFSRLTGEMLRFAGRFYFALGVPENENIQLFFRVFPAADLHIEEKGAKFTCRKNDLEIRWENFSEAGALLDAPSAAEERFLNAFREHFIKVK